MRVSPPAFVIAVAMVAAGSAPVSAQWYPAGREARLGSMMDQGLESFDTPQLALRLVKSSGTVASLTPKLQSEGGELGVAEPKADRAQLTSFDFAPSELLAARSTDGYYHLGDLDLRLRVAGQTEWKGYSSALLRRPVKTLPGNAGDLARQDLAETFPADFPLQVTRIWTTVDDKLALRFLLTNPTRNAIEIGALGIPLIFDNIMSGKSLEEAHAVCSFADPSISEGAGYVQVTRLNGHGPALLVVPDGNTPLEAYNPIAGTRGHKPELFADLTPRNMTFEGFYEWMAASAAYQQQEWKQAEPWNAATSMMLQPGQSRTVGLRFLVSPSIRDIEKTLVANGRPVAIGFPGYILPKDVEGSLFLKYPANVHAIKVEPADAIEITEQGTTEHGWLRYQLRGRTWGRARITVTYTDGLEQTIAYRVMKPEAQAVDDLGNFLFNQQWFDKKEDLFHRSPSVISYDRQANSQVTEDNRVWIAGLSDEAGAGSWLAAAMKEYARADKQQVEKLEEFVDRVLWGGIQFSDGPRKFGVRKSLFYYQPDKMPPGTYDKALDWSGWESWSQEASEDTGRSYNYPHVVAAYWALYRIARDHQGLATHHDWQWYLSQAYETTMAMTRFAPDLAQFGQMEGDIFVAVLEDLRRESMNEQADALEKAMRARAEVWRKLPYPFGSEMPWDSTGQEEVYAWSRHFAMDAKADITLDAITGYMPAIPSWGYNGSARRYWDFLYGGKYRRIERQLHHYGSGINAIPVLDAYRRNPSDLYLLRIGYGGVMGAVSGIDEQGFASAAFHSYPDKMIFDPYTGDYGPNFFGHAWASAAYLVNDPEFGWQAFGGNVSVARGRVTLEPRDSLRQRVYLAPVGLWLTLDSGMFESVEWNAASRTVEVRLAPEDAHTQTALLRIEQPAHVRGWGKATLSESAPIERGGYKIALGTQPASIHINLEKQAGESQ